MTPEPIWEPLQERLTRLVDGAFDVSITDAVRRRMAPKIAKRAAELIDREIEWIMRGVHPEVNLL